MRKPRSNRNNSPLPGVTANPKHSVILIVIPLTSNTHQTMEKTRNDSPIHSRNTRHQPPNNSPIIVVEFEEISIVEETEANQTLTSCFHASLIYCYLLLVCCCWTRCFLDALLLQRMKKSESEWSHWFAPPSMIRELAIQRLTAVRVSSFTCQYIIILIESGKRRNCDDERNRFYFPSISKKQVLFSSNRRDETRILWASSRLRRRCAWLEGNPLIPGYLLQRQPRAGRTMKDDSIDVT